MVLSRGLTGDHEGEPKVACPMHKKTFSLRSGACLSDDGLEVRTFPVRVVAGMVQVGRPDDAWVTAERSRSCSRETQRSSSHPVSAEEGA